MNGTILNRSSAAPTHSVTCDQCVQRRMVCDRQLPTCLHCDRNQLTCTRNRSLKKYPTLHFENVSPFSLNGAKAKSLTRAGLSNQNSKKNSKTINSAKKLVTSFRSPSKGQPGIFTFKIDSDRSDFKLAFDRWFSVLKSRHDFFYFTRVTGFDLNNLSQNDKGFLAELFLKKIDPLNNQGSLQKQPTNDYLYSPEATKMIRLALDAYFHYSNPFFAPFTRSMFLSRSHSVFVKSTIVRVGLQFIKSSPLQRSLLQHFNEKLLLLIVPSALKVSLDTLQALIMLITGIFTPPINIQSRSLLHLAIEMAYCLGLDLGWRRRTPLLNSEVQMTLNALYQIQEMYSFRVREIMLPAFNGLTKFKKPNNLSQYVHFDPSKLYEAYLRRVLRTPEYVFNNPNLSDNSSSDSKQLAHEISNIIVNACHADFIDSVVKSEIQYNVALQSSFKSNFYQSLEISWKQLDDTFLSGFRHLQALKLIRVSSRQGDCYIFNSIFQDKDLNIFQTFNCSNENIAIAQMQVFLTLMYHSSRISLVNFTLKVNDLEKDRTKIHKYIEMGLTSAINLLDLLAKISYGPFTLQRNCLVTKAIRFIVPLYKEFSNSSKPSPISHESLNRAIGISRHILNISNILSGANYYFSVNVQLVDALLERNKITL